MLTLNASTLRSKSRYCRRKDGEKWIRLTEYCFSFTFCSLIDKALWEIDTIYWVDISQNFEETPKKSFGNPSEYSSTSSTDSRLKSVKVGFATWDEGRIQSWPHRGGVLGPGSSCPRVSGAGPRLRPPGHVAPHTHLGLRVRVQRGEDGAVEFFWYWYCDKCVYTIFERKSARSFR